LPIMNMVTAKTYRKELRIKFLKRALKTL